jgi:TolA-binding protein
VSRGTHLLIVGNPPAQRRRNRESMGKESRGLTLLSLFFCVLFAGCPSSQDQDLYSQAQEYWEKKMYGMAAQRYEQFHFAHPDHPKADQSLYKAASLYAYFLQDDSRAVELFSRLTVLYPDSAYRLKAHEQLAEILGSHLKSYPRAIAQYDKLIRLQKRGQNDLSELYMEQARCYFMMEDWKSARRNYEKILKEYPLGSFADKAAYQIGYTHFLEGHYHAAEKALRHFLGSYPKSEWAFDGMLQLARAKEAQNQSMDSADIIERLKIRFPERMSEIGLNGASKN